MSDFRKELDIHSTNYLFRAADVRGTAHDIVTGVMDEKDKAEENRITERLEYIKGHLDKTLPEHETQYSIEPNGAILIHLTFDIYDEDDKVIALNVGELVLRDLNWDLIKWISYYHPHHLKYSSQVMSTLIQEYDFTLTKKQVALEESVIDSVYNGIIENE